MKDIDEIREIVLTYATSTPLFITPQQIGDPVVPDPGGMSDSQFNRFFTTLHSALAEAGVRTNIRLAELRAVDTWSGLAAIVFGRQTS